MQLHDHLEFKNCTVYTAKNEQCGFAILNAVKIDSVLASFDLSSMNGLNVLHHFQIQYPQIPVIVMSSNFTSSLMRESLARGIEGYLSKQITAEQLKELHSFLRDTWKRSN